MASVSQFAAPKDGDASFWFVYNATPPGLPGAPERGDSFAVRSPQGRRGLILICVWHHSAGQLPVTAMPHSDLRMASLRWASQEATNVATASLFAAPRDGEASF